MSDAGPETREYAPGVTDPEVFCAMVEGHWLFKDGEYATDYGREIIGNRLGWLQQALSYGARTCEGTDLPFKTDSQILTEYAVLEELRTRADLIV